MTAVKVTLLGGFDVAVDEVVVPESAWRLRKARELVKLLALAPNHRLHREQAMDALWRDRAPAAAANNLNQAVYVARRALGADAIDSREEALVLQAEVDVDAFESAALHARRLRTPAAYRAALSLYSGELLPENRYDDWAELRRETLAALASELEQEAGALGTADVYELPAQTSSFVGRDRALSDLGSLLRRTRLLTLAGTGGVGKTRLALELARRSQSSYDAGAALVELAALDDPRLIPDAVAASLDIRALPSQDPVDAVIDFLATRTLLLVLDNCEHLLAAASKLTATLLQSAPRLTIVATSREPLRAPGEVVFRVPSLAIPDTRQAHAPRRLLGYEAVSLFVARAAAADPTFALDEENAEDVARICVRLDGLPLALELAAARIGALSADAISERLDDRFRLLRAGSNAAPTRQQTLSATLQWSHDLLEPEEAVLFRRLSIFAGGFALDAVEEVCPVDGPGAPSVADVLARLVEKSLVVVADRGSLRRYRLLETVRMYARERLEEAAEDGELAERHAAWALALALRERGSPRLDREAANLRTALDTLLARDTPSALRLCVALLPFWLRRIDLEEAKRRFAAALETTEGQTALRAEALLAAAAIHFRSGTLTEGLPLLEDALAVAAQAGDPRLEWRALQFRGEYALASDEPEVAVPWLERAIAEARRQAFEPGEALGVHTLGVAAWVLGDLARADELVALSIEGFRELAGSAHTITSPLNIAEVLTDRPEGGIGLRHVFEDTLQPLVEITCDAAVSYALANRAGIARARGDNAGARALLDESAGRFERAHDDAGFATVLVRRAYIDLADGELEAARAQLERALELRAGLGDRRGRGLVLAGLGLVETTAGEHQAAERHLSEAVDLFRRAGDRWGLVGTLWRAADAARERDRLAEAETALQEALAVVSETGRERWIATTLVGLAELALARGEIERASGLLTDARARYAVRSDARGVASVEERLRSLAK